MLPPFLFFEIILSHPRTLGVFSLGLKNEWLRFCRELLTKQGETGWITGQIFAVDGRAR